MRYGIIGALYLAASGAYASDLTVNLDLPIQNEPVVYANEPAAVPVDVTALPDLDGVAAANVEDYFAEEFDSSRSAIAAFALDVNTEAYFEVFDRSLGYMLVTRKTNGTLQRRLASDNFNASGSLPSDATHSISQMFYLNDQMYAFSQSGQVLNIKTGSGNSLAWQASGFQLPAQTSHIYQRNDALYAFVDSGSDAGIWRLQAGAAVKVSSLSDATFKWGQESGTVVYGLKYGELWRDDLTDSSAAQSIANQVDSFWPSSSGVLIQRITAAGSSLHWYDTADQTTGLIPSELASGEIRLLPSCSANFGVVSCLAMGLDSKWYTAAVSAQGVAIDSRFQSAVLNATGARVYDITAIGSNRFIAAGTTSSVTLQKVLPAEELLVEVNPTTLDKGLGDIEGVFSYRIADSGRFYTIIRSENYIVQASFDVQGDLVLRPVPATQPAPKDYLVFPSEKEKASIQPIGLCLALLLLMWRSRRMFKG
ncbi:MAG: hypothetical protein H7A09_11090 [Oceanospirillaceae bacterium]|nr:hypothetical protein [Oceanospirillaceae bacterium]MCP5350936.1 hypothetical protein [Oceanospirillaceae bacterium]